MKTSRAPIEVFSLSFLDVISCAFGAVVMLILLAKNGDDGEFNDTQALGELITAVTTTQQSAEQSEQQVVITQQALKQASAEATSSSANVKNLEATLAQAQRDLQQLQDQAAGLVQVQVQIEQKRAAINAGKAKVRVDEVGGIPVDSDYVVFIVDTSGSMKAMWGMVMNTLDEVLNNHPQVKGFQVISDNGDVLGNNSLGSWRSDSRISRRVTLAAMRSWSGSSNSSPVEGIEAALKTYGKRTESLALYVFGDDYTGGSYDQTLSRINKLNEKNGKKIARIHAVAFKPNNVQFGGEVMRFSTLMREVAKQNEGTFLAL